MAKTGIILLLALCLGGCGDDKPTAPCVSERYQYALDSYGSRVCLDLNTRYAVSDSRCTECD